jgi:hypothetical protein
MKPDALAGKREFAPCEAIFDPTIVPARSMRCLAKRLPAQWNWASGRLVATALPAGCSPVALVMLRRSFEGVTMELRWGFEGNMRKSGV